MFSGFSGGMGVLLGPTGGYLIGYVLCAMVAGWLTQGSLSVKCGKAKNKTVFAMAAGTVVCYLFGTAWFLVVMQGSYSFGQALMVCVVPYLFFDAVKIMVAAMLAVPLKKMLW